MRFPSLGLWILLLSASACDSPAPAPTVRDCAHGASELCLAQAEQAIAEENPQAARDALRRGCEGGHRDACSLQARLLALGWEVPGWTQEADREAGTSALEELCQRGSGRACRDLADVLDADPLRAPSSRHILSLRTRACQELSFDDACVGNLIHSRPVSAERFAMLARYCAQENAFACAWTGRLLFRGEGAERNVTNAMPLLRQACDAGQPLGCTTLAEINSGEHGRPADRRAMDAQKRRAFELVEARCRLNEAGSCALAAQFHRDGYGTAPAPELFRVRVARACALGSATACIVEGQRHHRDPTSRDLAAAANELALACRRGVAEGCTEGPYALFGAIVESGAAAERVETEAQTLLAHIAARRLEQREEAHPESLRGAQGAAALLRGDATAAKGHFEAALGILEAEAPTVAARMAPYLFGLAEAQRALEDPGAEASYRRFIEAASGGETPVVLLPGGNPFVPTWALEHSRSQLPAAP